MRRAAQKSRRQMRRGGGPTSHEGMYARGCAWPCINTWIVARTTAGPRLPAARALPAPWPAPLPWQPAPSPCTQATGSSFLNASHRGNQTAKHAAQQELVACTVCRQKICYSGDKVVKQEGSSCQPGPRRRQKAASGQTTHFSNFFSAAAAARSALSVARRSCSSARSALR